MAGGGDVRTTTDLSLSSNAQFQPMTTGSGTIVNGGFISSVGQPGSDGPGSGSGSAGSKDSALTGRRSGIIGPVPNGTIDSYGFLAKALNNAATAYRDLVSAATPIPWAEYGVAAEGAGAKYTALAEGIKAVTAELTLLQGQKEMVGLLEKLAKVAPLATSTKGLTAMRNVMNSPTTMELLGEQKVMAQTTEGWSSMKLRGTGAASHEAMQLFGQIQTQMIRGYSSGMNTIDPRTLDTRIAQVSQMIKRMDILQDSITRNPENPVTHNRLGSHELRFLNGSDELNPDGTQRTVGQFYNLQNDLLATQVALRAKSLEVNRNSPINGREAMAAMGAANAKLAEYRANGGMGLLSDARTWNQKAGNELESRRDQMSLAEYTRLNSRLNIQTEILDKLKSTGGLDPLEASKQVRGGFTALSAEMTLMRKGEGNLEAVNSRHGKISDLLTEYGAFLPETQLAAYQAQLKTRAIEVAAYQNSVQGSPGSPTKDALSMAAQLNRNYRWTGMFNQGEAQRAIAGLDIQVQGHKAVFDNPTSTQAMKDSSEKQMEKLISSMSQLKGLTEQVGGGFGKIFNQVGSAMGMAVGIYSVSHALSQAFSKALEFEHAMNSIDVQLRRLPGTEPRKELSTAIHHGAVSDALNYGMDLATSAHARATSMMGSRGSMEDRERLATTMSQLSFIAPEQHNDYQAMVAPLTNAGLGAGEINRFMQVSQGLEGRYQLAPDRFRGMLQAIASGSGGLGTLTDWDTLQAVGLQEAVSTRDRMMGSKLNRIQTVFRSNKSVSRMKDILSRGGSRDSVGGMGIEDIMANGSPMLAIDNISNLYKTGDLGDSEVGAIAQIMDKRSSPSVMNMLHTGLDDWRGQIKVEQARVDGGFISTDEAASKKSETMKSSVDRINVALGSFMTQGLNPFGKALALVADGFTRLAAGMSPVINFMGSAVASFALGLGAVKASTSLYTAGKRFYDNTSAIGSLQGGGFLEGMKQKGMSGMGGMVGIGVGIGASVIGWGMDEYAESKRREGIPHNKAAEAGAILSAQESDGQTRALSLMSEIQSLRAKGLLTTERSRSLEDSLTAAIGSRKTAEEFVLAVQRKETAEIQKQIDLMTQLPTTGGQKAGDSLALLGNFGSTAGGKDAIQMSKEQLISLFEGDKENEKGERQNTGAQHKLFGRVVDEVTGSEAAATMTVEAKKRLQKIGDPRNMTHAELVKWLTPDRISSFGEEIQRDLNSHPEDRDTTLFNNNWADPDHTKGLTLAESLKRKDLGQKSRNAQAAFNTGKTDAQLTAGVSSGVMDALFTSEASLTAGLTGIIPADSAKKLLATGGALNRDTTFNAASAALIAHPEFLAGVSNLTGAIGMRQTENTDKTFSYSPENLQKLANALRKDPTIRQKMMAINPTLGTTVLRMMESNELSGLTEGGVTNDNNKGTPGPKLLVDAWEKTNSAFHFAAQHGDAIGMNQATYNLQAPDGSAMFRRKDTAASAERKDIDNENEHYDLAYRIEKDPVKKAAIRSNQLEAIESIKTKWIKMRSVTDNPEYFRRQGNEQYHNEVVTQGMYGKKEQAQTMFRDDLQSTDGALRTQGQLLVKDYLLREEHRIGTSGKAMLMLDPDQQQAKRDSYLIQQGALRAEATKAAFHALGSEKAFGVWKQENADPVGLYAGEEEMHKRSTGILSAQIKIQQAYSDKLGLNNETLDEQITVTQNLVSMMKKRVELETSVIRAQKASVVGKEASNQVVDALFNLTGSSTMARSSNLISIGEGLVNRGRTDMVKRILDDSDNPLAKAASFIYDPTGAMDAQYAQQRLIDATQQLSDRIALLTQLLAARTAGAVNLENRTGMAMEDGSPLLSLGTINKDFNPAFVSGGLQTEYSSLFGAKSPLSGNGMFSRKFNLAALNSTPGIKLANGQYLGDSKTPTWATVEPGDMKHNTGTAFVQSIAGGKDIGAMFDADSVAVTKTLTGLGFEPKHGDSFTRDEITQLHADGKISEALAARQDQARNNPLTGIFGNTPFSKSFWDAGGAGRGTASNLGWFGKPATSSTYNESIPGEATWNESTGDYDYTDGVPESTTPGTAASPGVSNTGAAVGMATAAMNIGSAYYSNKKNGQASANYAGGSAAAGAAGGAILVATTTMGLANSWNPVGWALLAAAAIMSIMSGVEGAKHAAEEKNKQYETKLADFQKQIAIQEEQKKAIGLMAEKVLAIRGDVGNTFEGIASSAFLSGRFAGRSNATILVDKLTVLANDPVEFSKALTGAISKQVRQGAL